MLNRVFGRNYRLVEVRLTEDLRPGRRKRLGYYHGIEHDQRGGLVLMCELLDDDGEGAVLTACFPERVTFLSAPVAGFEEDKRGLENDS